MSNVIPNGQIRFFENIPIDANYENSLDFLTKEEQYTYFLGLPFIHRMVSATRVRDGVISVNTVSDTLLNANYMMFQNENFSSKWFFAFIVDVQYVNNNMCYVFYQIDDIQTWMFDVSLKECFVEREHTETDGLFEHLIDEGLNTSEYINSDISTNELSLGVYDAVLFTSYNPMSDSGVANVAPAQGNLNGLVGLDFQVQNNSGQWLPLDPDKNYDEPTPEEFDEMNPLEKLNSIIRQLTNLYKNDSLVSLVLIPRGMIEQTNTSYPKNMGMSYTNYTVGDSINGYIPVNNKLYNSPYCMIEIGSSDGQKEYLQPEFLLSGQNQIDILPNVSPTPNLLIVPMNYRGDSKAWDKALSFDAFPQCAMSIDGYSAWVASGGLEKAQNNALQNVTGGLLSTLAGNYIGGAVSTLESIISTQVDIDTKKRLPETLKGNINTQALTTNQQIIIYQRRKTIKKDIAMSIDNHFTMFGYKVNKVKQPSRRNRPHYTYLKTKGCHVDGGAPADAIQRIETIYDNGIRFWVNASEVGNYSVNNAPV